MKFLPKILAILAMATIPTLASAQQLSPGNEYRVTGTGGDTNVTLSGSSSGGVIMIAHTNVKAAFVGGVPSHIAKVETNAGVDDVSGKGKMWFARPADNPTLQGAQLCYKGLGRDFGQRFCAPLASDGSATVAINVPAGVKNVTVGLTPFIVGSQQAMYATHSAQLRRSLRCPALPPGMSDMGSMLRLDENGNPRPPTALEVRAYEETPETGYMAWCGLNREVNNVMPNF